MSQNSQKTTVPSNQQGGLELSEVPAGNLQVVRPAGAQLPQAQPSGQIGQGIVPPNAQPRPANNNDNIDDIAHFFRNRQMVVQGSVGMSPVLKFFIFFCVVTISFIAAWNYIGQFRKASQQIADQYLGINLADYIPGWTKRAKKFERKVDKEMAARPVSANKTTGVGARAIDPMYLAVVGGFYPQVEKHLQGKCTSWRPQEACSVKAWLLAYRGMKATLRPIAKFKPNDLNMLPYRERAVFQFALASANDGPESFSLFQKSLATLGQDVEFRRMLFDARFKQALRDGRSQEIPSLVKMAKDMSTSTADISRWRSMQVAVNAGAGAVRVGDSQKQVIANQLQETLQKHAGPFKSDPLAFVTIANVGLQVGLSRRISAVAVPLAEESLKVPMDPGLRRDLFIVAARSLMLSGNSVAAAEKLQVSKTKDGVDGISSHLLGSILLDLRSKSRLTEAIESFQAAGKMRNAWQSKVGLLLAYVRSGNLREAGRLANNLITFRTKESAYWMDVALAEHKLAVAKSGEGQKSKDLYKQVATSMAPLYSKYPDWSGLAKLYADALTGSGQMAEAQKVRMSIDDTSSKTSYLSSQEFMMSPVGPFGLMR